MKKLMWRAGILWMAVVLAAVVWCFGLRTFAPATSEFAALPVYLLGLPWSALLASRITHGFPGEWARLGLLCLIATLNPALLLLAARMIPHGGENAAL